MKECRFLPVFLFLLLIPVASATGITRSFSSQTVAPGGILTVYLDVSVTGGETFYALDETLPTGFTVTDPGSGDTSESGHVKWAVIQDAESTRYQYQVKASSLEGLHSFSGEYMFEGMSGLAEIGGQNQVTVASGLGQETYVIVIVAVVVVIALVFFIIKKYHMGIRDLLGKRK